MIAALCVSRVSIYKTIQGVECYDIDRDARMFNGGMSIVAHPPCRAWSAYCAHQAKPLPGEKELGLWCAEKLRECGGVLEHPAYSRLFDAAGLPKPGQPECGGMWSMAVDQSWWGDPRKKSTWLCFSNVPRTEIEVPFVLRSCRGDRRRWQVMSKHQRSATCEGFARWLVDCARLASC